MEGVTGVAMMKPRPDRVAWAAVSAVTLCVLLLLLQGGVATAGEIRVLSAVGVKAVMTELARQFEQSSGHQVRIDYGTVGALVGASKRVKARTW
jgi:ABC-type molybdate transport system substrate-binding protein